MKAVILSAGMGLRLGALTQNTPKVMLPVNGKPLLEWHIRHLKKFDIKEIFINTHYKPENIIQYFGNGKAWGVHITYSHEEKLYGTSGALTSFINKLDERFFLLYGDIYTTIDIDKLEQFHIGNRASVTVAVQNTDHPRDSDLIEMDRNKKIAKIYYKPHTSLPATKYSLAAVYMMEPSVLRHLPTNIPSDFEREFLPNIIKNDKNVFCYHTDEMMEDIGTPNRYQKVFNYFINKLRGKNSNKI